MGGQRRRRAPASARRLVAGAAGGRKQSSKHDSSRRPNPRQLPNTADLPLQRPLLTPQHLQHLTPEYFRCMTSTLSYHHA